MKINWYRSLVVLVGVLVLVGGASYLVQAAPPKQEPTDYETLFDKAQNKGIVRLIVGLNISYQPEGDIVSPQVVQTQRQRIAQAQDNVLRRLSSTQVTSIKRFKYIPFMAMEVDAAALTVLVSSTDVTSIEEDIFVPATLGSSTPIIGANYAWASGFEGAGQTIAILDTGVEASHPFLSGKVVSEACYSTHIPTSGIITLCPNGSTEQIGPGSANPNVANCLDLCDHGTHVAGIAAGNGITFDGVARSANIIAVQVFTRFNNPPDCPSDGPFPCVLTYTSDQIKGLERVYELRNSFNIAAVNMSLGGGQYTGPCDAIEVSRKTAIDLLRSVNIATIASSGNDEYTNAIIAPACISTAISVGATNDSDAVAWFSNSANFLDLLAPGVNIESSVPGGNFSDFDGTSMAAPHVAGAWAVLKAADPSASIDKILAALKNSGVPVTDSRNNITTPRIQLNVALHSRNCAFDALLTRIWRDDHEDGVSGWAATESTGGNSWQFTPAGDAYSGNNYWFIPDIDSSSLSFLTSPPIDVTGTNPLVRFIHKYDMEGGYDGGTLDLNINDDIWGHQVANNKFVQNGYDDTLETCCGNPLGGSEAFTGQSPNWPDYGETLADIGYIVDEGDTLEIMFTQANDSSVSDIGWTVDDVELYVCTSTASGSPSGNVYLPIIVK